MAPIGDHRFQHAPEQRGDLEFAKLGLDPAAHLRAQSVGIERFEHLDRQLACSRLDPRIPGRPGIGEVTADRTGKVHRPHPAAHDRRRQEIVTQEPRHRIGDTVLVLGNDRRMRDWQAERAAEQRGHREPVRQPADHRGFCEGVEITPSRVFAQISTRPQEQRRHEDDQPRRRAPHHPCAIRRDRYAGSQPARWQWVAHSAGSAPGPRLPSPMMPRVSSPSL